MNVPTPQWTTLAGSLNKCLQTGEAELQGQGHDPAGRSSKMIDSSVKQHLHIWTDRWVWKGGSQESMKGWDPDRKTELGFKDTCQQRRTQGEVKYHLKMS
ncbi:hypothetical protein Bbelb_204020 [Branchiostoma belcheri]|nr:hypothetical protein Bbelb_204020 [Branchiostoma belcheri]